jgi:hypothetical protein
MNLDDDFQVSCIKMMITHCDKAAKAAEGLAAAAPTKKSVKKSKKQKATSSSAPEVESFKGSCQHLSFVS